MNVTFQPIANIHSGCCFGYEVLISADSRQGLASTEALLDAAFAADRLVELELAVRQAVARQAALLPFLAERALFLNMDARIVGAWDQLLEASHTGLQPFALQLVTEIAARPPAQADAPDWSRALKRRGGMVAVDRLGDTADGLHLLLACDPDFIKIDRALIKGIDSDARKRVVVTQLIGMAHTLGVQVIAVGVENGRECLVCRELGVDLVQGNFIQPPSPTPKEPEDAFPQIVGLARNERHRRQIDQKWVLQQLEPVPAIRIDTPINKVFERVARNPDESFIPVVDHLGQPLGIVRERNMKNFAYSAFGKDLIANKALGRSVRDFLVRCPITDVATPLDQMLAIYSTIEDAEGILITEQMIYRGFLSARSIIRAIHEKTLARARDENPLTKLPGNSLISEYLVACIGGDDDVVLAYVDFDDFKPFNDKYGFRQGDRAILLFAELMRKEANPQTWFLGHIGGDDFFIGLKGVTALQSRDIIGGLISRFASDAESFYDAETRARGFMTAQDREGRTKSFPLLSASAVLLILPAGSRASVDDLSSAIALKKKQAKSSSDKLAMADLVTA